MNISSIVVLMLENRSFDHMLGFLDHPDTRFARLTGSESNPHEPATPRVPVSMTAKRTIPLDPAHNHEDVMLQLTGRSNPRPPYTPNNEGFVTSYEQHGLRRKRTRGFARRSP